MGASKIFCTYLLPFFLLENTKNTVFQTSNLPLAFQNKWILFFHRHLYPPLTFKNNLCHIIWTWKSTPKVSSIFKKLGVATLTLDLRPRQGLTKVRAKSKPRNHISWSQECKRVWGNEPPHSQMSSHFVNWSPNELPNLQKAIARVKTHWIKKFFIWMESSWKLDA
jgi:hypothetical protein